MSAENQMTHRAGSTGDEKTSLSGSGDKTAPYLDPSVLSDDYEGKPTEEELRTLRRVPGNLPVVAYMICAVEFCERASYYGVQPLVSNYVNRKFPVDGNGYGAPPPGQGTAGALGMGTVTANAVSQSFSMLAYTLPMISGYLADAKTGRFKLITWGVAVFGAAHIILCAAGAPSLLQNGNAKIPFFIGLYMLAVGAALFKPNVTPLLLDQITTKVPTVRVLKNGERVIEDPEATAERAMLWFYLLINIGGFMGVPTTYIEKYVGWWLAFLLPLILYLPLPLLLWWLRKRLILHPPGGSDLPNVFRILGVIFRRGGIMKIGRKGFWDLAKPSSIAAAGLSYPQVRWNDEFVDDAARAFQATGIFCFFPIQYLTDNGIGNAASFLSTMLTTNGVPNDVLGNFNSLSIIAFSPILNYGLYPLLRKANIHYGPAARIFTGFMLSTLASLGYTLLQYYTYQQSPCGEYGSSDCEIGDGVAPITIWWMALPYGLGGISELFVNVPAYGIAYSRSPVNMRGLVSALNLLNTAVAYAIGLACSSVITDPYLVWDFGGVTIAGGVCAVIFYVLFHHIDQEEYRVSQNTDYHLNLEGTVNVVGENELNHSINRPAPIAENEEMMISVKQ